jgi:hypothetical protein
VETPMWKLQHPMWKLQLHEQSISPWIRALLFKVHKPMVLHCATAFVPISLVETWQESGDLCGSFSSTNPTIAQEIHNVPPVEPSSKTPIQLVFYEDDIIIHYHSFDRFFSVFSNIRLPFSARHLSDLRSFPLFLDAFVIYHFGNDLVNYYIGQPSFPPKNF